MRRKSGFTTTALIAGLLTTTSGMMAQPPAGDGVRSEKRTVPPQNTGGIRTDRLSHRQQRLWQCIRRVVFAANAHGEPLHPKLQALWRSVDESGSTVYVEMPRGASVSNAGRLVIEKRDQKSGKHVFSIHLYLNVIDKAVVCDHARRANGLIPFEGLNRHERYAEVLGHELAHAAAAARDSEYLNQVNEQERLNEVLRSSLRERGRLHYDEDTRSLLSTLARLHAFLEAEPLRMEKEVWRELAGHGDS